MSQDPLVELYQPGEPNKELAGQFSEDGTILLDTEGTCDLCLIPGASEPEEEVFQETEEMYVARTATPKGHDIRNMVVVKEHGRIPSRQKIEEYKEVLKDVTARQIGDGAMIVFGSMNSIPDHWHLIASDLSGDDLTAIHDFEFYRVEDGEYTLLDERKESKVGKRIL